MSPTMHVILSISLSMGVPLVWAVRELFVMRADARGSLGGGPDVTPEPRPLPPELTVKKLPPGLVVPDYVLARVARSPEQV